MGCQGRAYLLQIRPEAYWDAAKGLCCSRTDSNVNLLALFPRILPPTFYSFINSSGLWAHLETLDFGPMKHHILQFSFVGLLRNCQHEK